MRFTAFTLLARTCRAFFRSDTAVLHSSSNHGLLRFFGLLDVLGIVFSAMLSTAELKPSIGSGRWARSSYFRCSRHNDVNSPQFAFARFQCCGLVGTVPVRCFKIMGRWSLPHKSSCTCHEKSR